METGIDAAEEHTQPGRDYIGHRPPRRCEHLGPGGTCRPHPFLFPFFLQGRTAHVILSGARDSARSEEPALSAAKGPAFRRRTHQREELALSAAKGTAFEGPAFISPASPRCCDTRPAHDPPAA